MGKSWLGSFLLIVVSLFTLFGFGHSLNVSVTPTNVTGTVPIHVTVTCHLDKNDLDVSHVTNLSLARDPKGILAVVEDDQSLRAGGYAIPGALLSGEISEDPVNSYIKAEFANPELDEGRYVYTCILEYVDGVGRTKKKNSVTSLTVSNDEANTAIQHFMDKLNSMVAELNDLREGVATIKDTVSKFEKDTVVQIEEFELFVQQALQQIIFFAGKSTNPNYVKRLDNYDMDFYNDIKGYGNDGWFTAPISGYYLLHLSATAKTNTWAEMDILTDKGATLARFRVGDKTKPEHSSTSIVTKMEVGDKVTAKRSLYSKTFNYYHRKNVFDSPLHIFYGYLIKRA